MDGHPLDQTLRLGRLEPVLQDRHAFGVLPEGAGVERATDDGCRTIFMWRRNTHGETLHIAKLKGDRELRIVPAHPPPKWHVAIAGGLSMKAGGQIAQKLRFNLAGKGQI
ncbi:hypothetical protein RA280_11820 [Cupriavidus sp. CV2]|uniref:hypothetical protein n=1 Tax=Cupriavidus ulmosensis TaxID=3065913 RepID=UPI00296AF80E|nr:hypothetical protein [Cupriavidus sp. CV2]MDW3682421.1 hypothetical protein [Cupriavidus sp. CV2]